MPWQRDQNGRQVWVPDETSGIGARVDPMAPPIPTGIDLTAPFRDGGPFSGWQSGAQPPRFVQPATPPPSARGPTPGARDLGLTETAPGSWEFQGLPPSMTFSPEDFGLGPGGPPVSSFTPDPITAPPARGVNPSLAGREQFMRDREGRIGGMFDRYQEGIKADDPANRSPWARLGEIASRIAADGDLANAGVITYGYLGEERDYRREAADTTMRLGLAREDLTGETAEAGFAADTGEFEASEGTARDAYGVDVANTQQGNEARASNLDRQDRAGTAAWAAQRDLALAEYQNNQGRLDAATSALAGLGGEGGLAAAGSLFGVLPVEMQEAAVQRLREEGLTSMIQQDQAAAGTSASRARNNVHRRMEGLAGRSIPRPPNRLVDAAGLARYYQQNGVSVNRPEVARAFPGIGRPE